MPESAKQLFKAFQEVSKTNAAKRKPISPRAFTLSDGPSVPIEKEEDGQLVKYRETTRQASATLSNMVFGDETAGKVFPGSLLWADAVSQDGRLEPLFPLKRSHAYRITVSDAVMKPGKPTTYKCDGTHANFAEVLAQITKNIAQSQAKLESYRSDISDSASALLQVGLSASGWGASLAATLKTTRESKRAVTLMSVQQAYFTLTCEPEAGQQHLDEAIFSQNPAAASLIDQSRTKGEIGVVRRVTYGRRLLLSISTMGSMQEFNAAVSAAYSGFGVNASGDLTAEQKKTLNQAEARLIVIGGKTDAVLVDNLVMPAAELLQKVSAYLGQGVNMDELTSAAVVGFDVEYAHDRAPVIKLDSCNFSEQIRESSRRAGGKQSLSQLPFGIEPSRVKDERIPMAGDTEIDTDDWTYTKLEYTLKPSPDGRAVLLLLTFDAREGNSDKSFGNTWFRLNRTEEVWRADDAEPRTIKQIVGPALTGVREEWFKDEKHGPQDFPKVGALDGVQVTFDAPGKHDLDVMNDTGNLDCVLELNAEGE